MAATLAQSMSSALEAEAVKRETEKQHDSERRVRKDALAKPGVNTDGKISPVVLTGEGVRLAREGRQNWLIGLAIVGVLAGLVWLFLYASAKDRALIAFTRPVDGTANRYGARVQKIQERAWLTTRTPGGTGVAAFVQMADPYFGAVTHIDLTKVRDSITALNGFTYFPELNVWAAKETREPLARLRAALRDPAKQLPEAAAKAKLTYQDHAELLAQWQESGLDAEGVRILAALLMGETNPGENTIAATMLSGDVPAGFDVVSFHGRKGVMLLDVGGKYLQKDVPYKGLLLRFTGGQNWSHQHAWRVFELTSDAAR